MMRRLLLVLLLAWTIAAVPMPNGGSGSVSMTQSVVPTADATTTSSDLTSTTEQAVTNAANAASSQASESTEDTTTEQAVTNAANAASSQASESTEDTTTEQAVTNAANAASSQASESTEDTTTEQAVTNTANADSSQASSTSPETTTTTSPSSMEEALLAGQGPEREGTQSGQGSINQEEEAANQGGQGGLSPAEWEANKDKCEPPARTREPVVTPTQTTTPTGTTPTDTTQTTTPTDTTPTGTTPTDTTPTGTTPTDTTPTGTTPTSTTPTQGSGAVRNFNELVPTPGWVKQQKYHASRHSKQIKRFGEPCPKRENCQGGTDNEKVKASLSREDVGPFTIKGNTKALESLRRIFAKVKAENPALYSAIGHVGMFCCRLVRGSTTNWSNHSFGTAIDLQINKVTDPYNDNTSQAGMIQLYPYFAAEKWYWGAGFSREDSMHMEISEELMQEWYPV